MLPSSIMLRASYQAKALSATDNIRGTITPSGGPRGSRLRVEKDV